MSAETPIAPEVGARLPRLAAFGLVVVLAALAGFLTFQAEQEADLAAAREDALAAATERLPHLLGYEHATLAEDLDRALGQTTGDFADDYRTILDDVVKPTATKRKISTSASVIAAGVVPGQRTSDRVVVLAFLNQSTTARDSGPTVTGSRVQVTMVRSGDQWKIAGLEPL